MAELTCLLSGRLQQALCDKPLSLQKREVMRREVLRILLWALLWISVSVETLPRKVAAENLLKQ